MEAVSEESPLSEMGVNHFSGTRLCKEAYVVRLDGGKGATFTCQLCKNEAVNESSPALRTLSGGLLVT